MMEVERNEIVFFDLETSVPREEGQRHTIVEFGAILVCPRRLVELDKYSTLIRPPYQLSPLTERILNDKGITAHDLLSAPFFSEVSDHIYNLLDGRVWAGHNIVDFDCPRIAEACEEIGGTPPTPKGHIDTLNLLNTFGKRAGNMKMATLASYFQLGDQTHRSIDDVLMNLEVLKYCSTVLFLEINYPILLQNEILSASAESEEFLEAHEISTHFLKACHRDSQNMILLHKNVPLQMRSRKMKPKIFDGKCISRKYLPRLSFLVEPTFESCCTLKECESVAKHYLSQCHSNSEWRPLLQSQHGSAHSVPPVRIHILTSGTGNTAQIVTDFYEKAPAGQTEKHILPTVDVDKLDELLVAGMLIDADYTFEIYGYQEYAGIKIIARRLTLEF